MVVSSSNRQLFVISSVTTVKLTKALGPNVVVRATSIASRPLAINTRPIRGTLFRGSKLYPYLQGTPRTKRRSPLDYREEVPNIAQITSAIARRNVHTSTECYSEMCEIPANACSLIKCFPGGPGRTSIFVTECYVVVDEVTNCLYSRPTGSR
jgi:hypothetical protein